MITVMNAQSLDSLIHWRVQKGGFLILSFCFHSLAGEILRAISFHPLLGYPLIGPIEERKDTGLILSLSTR